TYSCWLYYGASYVF
nr:immunoglobulin light chain junction region [Macaca mulatta]